MSGEREPKVFTAKYFTAHFRDRRKGERCEKMNNSRVISGLCNPGGIGASRGMARTGLSRVEVASAAGFPPPSSESSSSSSSSDEARDVSGT